MYKNVCDGMEKLFNNVYAILCTTYIVYYDSDSTYYMCIKYGK